jgi:hypothetical protein
MSRMPTPLRSEIGAPLRIEIAAIKGARFAKGMEISEVRPAAIAIWLGRTRAIVLPIEALWVSLNYRLHLEARPYPLARRQRLLGNRLGSSGPAPREVAQIARE